ncbi:MAG: CD225/dispanin family protein [Arenimonas sp.]
MKCPSCSAEGSGENKRCEFCGYQFAADLETVPLEASVPPPIPDFAPPPTPPSFESDNPYAASDSSTYGPPQILPAYEVPNHLALSISAAVLTLCFCCIPFGIVPVIFSTQVNSKLAAGDYSCAQSASNNAKLWSWICIGIALLVFVFSILVNLGTLLVG